MAYVSPDCPLPRNSLDPVTACEAARASAIVRNMEQSAANGRAASAQMALPASFTSMGQGVVRDAARTQGQVQAARLLAPQKASPVALRPAPRVLPLNVSEAEFSGCSLRGTDSLRPIPISPDQTSLVMPPRAPVDTGLLTTGNSFPAPAVVYQAPVQVAAAPAAVVIPGSGTWGRPIEPQREITMFMAYPNSPNPRPGLGVVWGDAVASPQAVAAGGISKNGWLLLLLAAGGLYAMSRNGK